MFHCRFTKSSLRNSQSENIKVTVDNVLENQSGRLPGDLNRIEQIASNDCNPSKQLAGRYIANLTTELLIRLVIQAYHNKNQGERERI
jgi:hypothetical protein